MNIQMGMGWGAEREFDNAKGQLHTQQDGASDLEIGERVQCSHQELLSHGDLLVKELELRAVRGRGRDLD